MNTDPTDKPTLKTPTDPEPVSLKPPVGVSPSQNLPSNNLDKNPWDKEIKVTPDTPKMPDIKPDIDTDNIGPQSLHLKTQLGKNEPEQAPTIEKSESEIKQMQNEEKNEDNRAELDNKKSGKSINFLKLLLFIAPLFALSSLAVFVLINQNNPQNLQGSLQTTIEDENQENKDIAIYGNGTDSAPYVIKSTSDPKWQKYQIQNLEIIPDSDNQELIIYWDNTNLDPKPYAWLIGYLEEDFEPNEKFHTEKLSENEQINWAEISKSSIIYNNKRYKQIIKINNQEVYFYFYVRTINEDGEYVDYIYGQDNLNQKPFYYNLN